ncbi:MAG: hypothetical protein CMM47_02400 [Rhodospirillaceae bacterium]|nr:hypothetical protein [Rhodospirillaceae bacterium]
MTKAELQDVMNEDLKNFLKDLLDQVARDMADGSFEDASNRLSRVMVIFPGHEKTNRVMFEVSIKIAKPENLAANLFRLRLLGLATKSDFLAALGGFVKSDRISDAVAFCKSLLRKQPNDPLTRFYDAEMASVSMPIPDYLRALRVVLVLEPSLAIAAAQYAAELGLYDPKAWGMPEVNRWRTRAYVSAPEDRAVRFALAYEERRHSILDMESWRKFSLDYASLEGRNGPVSLPLPSWNGQVDRNQRLLVWGTDRDGVGDILLHARCLRSLLEVGQTGGVRVPQRLERLICRSFPDWEVFSEPRAVYAEYGYCIRLLDLSGHVAPDETVAYLRADSNLRDNLRGRYRRSSDKPLIGLSWRGGSGALDRMARTVPLTELARLFCDDKMIWVSLQHGSLEDDEVRLAQDGRLIIDEDIDPYGDIDLFAAQVAAMDAVISVNNTTANLAAGLGLPTLCILPKSTQWWWGVEGDRTPWYPNMRLFRQAVPGQWDDVVERIVAAVGAPKVSV